MTFKLAMKTRILNLCHQRKLTLRQLAQISGVAESTIRSIVNGKRHYIMISTVIKLCDGFGITFVDFLNDDVFKNLDHEIK